MMRILFHYTHKQTLGHTTRSLSLAQALSDRGADVLILHGGTHQPFVRFPKKCKVADIPLPFDSQDSFQVQAKPVSTRERTRFILKAAIGFKPDVFITEFFPFGRQTYSSELLPAIEYLRKKDVRIMASIGYPLLANLDRFEDQKFMILKRATFALFDTFLIHTPPELENPYIERTVQPASLSRHYAAVLEKLEKRIVYTGYILPAPMITGGEQPSTTKASDTIIVSRGGGAVYANLITSAIEAQRHLDEKIHTIIACGPTTSEEEMALFRSRLNDQDKTRVSLVHYLDNLHDHLRACRISVGLCGYNTSIQMMHCGTPSVIVPYKNTSMPTPINDQVARARLLQEKFSSIVLDYENLTGPSLAEAIQKQLTRPRPAPAPADWFNGADVAAQTVLQNN